MWRWLVLTTIALAGCSERVETLATIASADDMLVASVEKTHFGGAAGGVSYCLVVHPKDRYDDTCFVLGSRLEKVNISWHKNSLHFSYSEGDIHRRPRENCVVIKDFDNCIRIMVNQVK